MASSKVMTNSTSANSDLARQSSIYSLTIGEFQNGQGKNFGSMSMDELFRNIYGDNPAAEITQVSGAGDGDGESNGGGISLSRQGSFSLPKSVGNKTVEEVWKEITAGGNDRKDGGIEEGQYYKEVAFEEMTLEDFLAKVGAVREEDVRIPATVGPGQEIFAIDSILSNQLQQHQAQQQIHQQVEGPIMEFGNGVEVGVRGRGKRRATLEPVDKVAQQRQKRMIKNRESAARSRERKQAYTVELESIVMRLEEEKVQLEREKIARDKERLKQLMECIIPIEEKRRPPRVLRRVNSLQW